MPVSMDDVRRVLDPDEPKYEAVSGLGAEALPHLQALVDGDDSMMASKAAYAASLLEGATGEEVVRAAAHSADDAVRVAAAAATANLPAESARGILADLESDADPGVRKVAANSAPAAGTEG
jgi:HEAT repeat protein